MPVPRKLFLQLRHKIEDAGYQVQDVAEHFGHTPSWASSRLSGQVPWSVADALKVCDLVGIPQDEIANYFKDARLVHEGRAKQNAV